MLGQVSHEVVQRRRVGMSGSLVGRKTRSKEIGTRHGGRLGRRDVSGINPGAGRGRGTSDRPGYHLRDLRARGQHASNRRRGNA